MLPKFKRQGAKLRYPSSRPVVLCEKRVERKIEALDSTMGDRAAILYPP